MFHRFTPLHVCPPTLPSCQARDELIDAVCKREMGVYTQIFATIGDTAKLERTVNRYKWLLKRLEARKEIWAIFPPGWHVPQLLCIMFCNITKTMLAEILDVKVGGPCAVAFPAFV
jgi:hypothetical protein